jgi:CRISPR-associated protein Cmr2
MALKSFGMLAANVHDFREHVLHQGQIHQTAKPYTVPELTALFEAVQFLKQEDFPRSQLYRLREQLKKGWLASSMDYLYFQSRIPHSQQLRLVLDDRWLGYDTYGQLGGTGIWFHRDKQSDADEDEWETVLGDIVEIYDFVPERDETHAT